MKNLNEIKLFSSVHVDRLYRSLVQTQNYSSYTMEKFDHDNQYAKGPTNILIDINSILDPEKDDLHNVKVLYDSLKEINEIQATDERLWTCLIHTTFWTYMRKRWPVEKAEKPINRIRDRYFLRTGNLETLTRNGLSRLWWYAHLTYDESRANKYELTDVLLKRADMVVQITERALGCNKNIRIALLEFFKENPEIADNETDTREIIKNLQLVGGVKVLPFLDKDELKEILYKVA